jgi:hypothetical protein
VATWARHDYEAMSAFEEDATLAMDRLPSSQVPDRRTTDYRVPTGSNVATS